MAISFKKEIILEAIQQVLAEAETVKKVIGPRGGSVAQAVSPEEEIELKKAGAKIEPMEEDHAENPNDESDMAKVQLANIIKYSQELLSMIPDGMQLDAWVQDKLSISFDYIDTVKHFLEGEEFLAATQAPQGDEELQAEARKRGQGTVQKELDTVKKHMMDLAKQYKAGDKSVVEKLKDLTAQKKALEKELEDVVAGIGAGQELDPNVD